jgi:acyl-coenzyme A synthetase/AMP-(fatty) acid ligase
MIHAHSLGRAARYFLELPKTGSGKILKRALRERFWAHQARSVS